jgi:phage tail-like protein
MDATTLTSAAALRFRVVVGGLEVGRFSRFSGLGFAYDVAEYPEGGEHGFTRTLRGPVRQATLTLERGVTEETALLDWFFASHDDRDRRPITVFLLDDAGEPLRHWAFDRALPLRWEGPDLDAGGAAVAMETRAFSPARAASAPPRDRRG